MLTPENPRRRLRGISAALVMAATMLMPATATVAMDAQAAEIDPATTDLEQERATLIELHSLVDELATANDALVADNSSLLASVAALETERDRLRDSLDRFDDLYGPLEADRQLLIELRKGLPETRPEAEAQIDRIRRLALSADPARLGQLVDRIDDTAPTFLDWRFGDHVDDRAFASAYIDSGANAFDSSMEEFRSEVLMSVSNRLDGLLTVLDRVR